MYLRQAKSHVGIFYLHGSFLFSKKLEKMISEQN
ncbi:hypothetical protein BCE_A0207 (plasmid) [Bacillus cereus ATCC 10987]|uniref:Uncharacterized protein n=1 Tax=Bacillus cereus (strain ATCC 10987 / NRS 248) TaxID=222523 RepID=Q74NN7_BACC1|nr:hypothetical protein BCE_A0207 [Bacillus cereus ATCC 10987]